jgi:hypothetical protein
MALETKQNKRSAADDSKLDSYGVWVKNPPTAAKAQAAQNSREGDSSEISSEVFLDDISSDSSFDDVFESIESGATDVSASSGIAEKSRREDENLPEEFLNTESCDNVKFTVSDSELDIITKEVTDSSAVPQEEYFDPPADAVDKNEKKAHSDGGFDSAAKDILKQIASELAALKNEISLLKADFDELKNQEIIRPPASSMNFSETIDFPAREEDFSSEEEITAIADDLAAETEDQSGTEESQNGFFSEDSDDETIALSGDELQNILTNSEFSTDEETGGIAEGISGTPNSVNEELPEISEETNGNIFIEEDDSQNESEKSIPADIENVADNVYIESEPENLGDKNAIDDISVESEIEVIDLDSEAENLDAENAIDDIGVESEIGGIDLDSEAENLDAENAINEIENISGTKIADIDIESEDLHEPEFADIEFDDFDDFEETALPEEIDIPMAEKDDILVEEDFEIKNIAEAEETFEAPFDNDLIADEEIELAKESSETDEIETEITTDGQKPAEKAESVEEELDDTPTDKVFGKQWGETQEDAAKTSAAFAAEQSPQAEKLDSGLKEQVKTVLSYMDKLLENLPEEKISEFARSEYFDTYKKLFEELGIA